MRSPSSSGAQAYSRSVLRRYLIPCAAVVVLALVVAGVAYVLTPVGYTATCTFTFSLPVTSSPAQTDAIAFQNETAANQVGQASAADIYSGTANAVGLDPGAVAGEVAVVQVPGSSNFTLTASDSQAPRATDVANRMCDAYVQRITAQVQQQRDSEVTQLQAKIAQLQQSIATVQATPAPDRSAADQTFLQAQQQAITADQQLLATTLALPPDNIAVVTRAPGGVRSDTRSASRNLLVAGVAALLACFLIVLVGEAAREQRPSRA
jgi:Holliday junction resolvasome RuvABC endonuclease subunit